MSHLFGILIIETSVHVHQKRKKKITQKCKSGAKKIQKKKLAYNIEGYTFPYTLFK